MNLTEISLLLLRLSISYIWLTAGLSKLFNPQFISNYSSTITNFAKNCGYDFYTDFLNKYVIHNSYIFAQLTTWGEILTGVAFLIGFPMSIAAIVGIFMNLNYYFVATSTPSQFVNIIMIFSQFAAYANNAGAIWGLTPKISRK